ncbi:MAG: RlmE family RNA methyltransferase [Candidatus Peribacteraceae bacterium]
MPKPYTPNDKWSRRAAAEGFRARSVYKLQELDERYHFFAAGMRVLDVGAAPGSWLQYAAKAVGPRGMVLGIDFMPIEPVASNVRTCVCDVLDQVALEKELRSFGREKFDLILSDLAPNTSGIKDRDQWRSIELSRQVALLAVKYLRSDGVVVMKVFRGRDFDQFTHELRSHFRSLKVASVKASRDRSREVYLVCRRENQ